MNTQPFDIADVREQIVLRLEETLNVCEGDIRAFPMDEELRDLGLDSMGMISLLLEIESQLQFVFSEDEIHPDVFKSANSLVDFVRESMAKDQK